MPNNSGFGNCKRKSQLYNARGKKLQDVPVTSKLPSSPSVSLSKIQPSPSGSSLFKDTGDGGKGRKQCTSPNKLKKPNKPEPPPSSSPMISSNNDIIPNISNKSQESHDKRPLEVPETISEALSPTNSPQKSTSFFQRFFQR